MNLKQKVSLDLVLRYTMYVLLIVYSLWGVNQLTKAQLSNFENIYFRLALIILLVLSASVDPIICLLLAISFLMTHQRLQELKKVQTNNKVDELQEKQNNKIKKLREMNKELKANNNHLSVIVNEKLKNINEPFHIENTTPISKDISQDEIDEKFNYMHKKEVVDAIGSVNHFFDAEKSFEKISSNLV